MRNHPLKQLCADSGLKVEFIPISKRSNVDSWAPDAKHFQVKITYKKRKAHVEYSIGSGVDKPRAADLIHSLLLDASSGRESFEDFCSNCGYDTDSRKAHTTWLACQENAAMVGYLFGDDLSTFEEAAQDY